MAQIKDSFVVGLDIGRHSSRAALYEGFGLPFRTEEVLSLVSPFVEVGDFSLGAPSLSIRVKCLGGESALDGQYFIGKNVLDSGMKINVAMEGETFIRTSCVLALALLLKMGINGAVTLGHVLTDENSGTHEIYKGHLAGKSFRIESLTDSSVYTEVEVKGLYLRSQSMADAYEISLDDGMTIRPDVYEADGLCVNFGRKTVDFCFVSKLNIISPQSVPMGSYVMLKPLRDAASAKLGTPVSDEKAEALLLNAKGVMNNKPYDLGRDVETAAVRYSEQVMPVISQFLSQREVGWVCFSGGGSVILEKYLKKQYGNYQLVFHKRPTFSSVLGLSKWLCRALMSS